MKLTVKNILTKYPTQIKVENIHEELQNTDIFKDNYNAKNITLEDLQKPTHTPTEAGNKYTYKIREYTLIIKDYPEINVELIKPSNENPYPYRWLWTEDGTQIHF